MSRYVALLRGINVGGKNLIKMTALKACFEKHGLRERQPPTSRAATCCSRPAAPGRPRSSSEIEEMLGATFNYPGALVLRSRKQLREVVARAPAGFGSQPALYRYDAIFLKDAVKASAAHRDSAHPGGGRPGATPARASSTSPG